MSQDKNTHAQPRATKLQIDAENVICTSDFFEDPRSFMDFFAEMHISHLNYMVINGEQLDMGIVNLYENLYSFLKEVEKFSETHYPRNERSTNG